VAKNLTKKEEKPEEENKKSEEFILSLSDQILKFGKEEPAQKLIKHKSALEMFNSQKSEEQEAELLEEYSAHY
jgi:hypothetical protein